MNTAEDIVSAVSGKRCYMGVQPEFRDMVTEGVSDYWKSMMMVLRSITSDDLDVQAPVVLVVSTPRASPYSFMAPDAPYLVVDQQLLRGLHRFTRLAFGGDITSDMLYASFDELYAERAFVAGFFQASALAAFSWGVRLERIGGSHELHRYDEPTRELQFQLVSMTQQFFVVLHELAHMALSQLRGDQLEALHQWRRSRYVWGEPQRTDVLEDTTPLLDPEHVASIVDGNPRQAEECLCDLVAVTTLANDETRWPSVLSCARTALAHLQCIFAVDRKVEWHHRGKIRKQNQVQDPYLAELTVRDITLVWISNAVRQSMKADGLLDLAAKCYKEVEGRPALYRQQITYRFADFSAIYLAAFDKMPRSVLRGLREFSKDIDALWTLLGFGDAPSPSVFAAGT